MKLRLNVWPLQVALLLLCLSANATAQTTTSGGLTGIVTDPSGAVVPNADVEIKDDAKGDDPDQRKPIKRACTDSSFCTREDTH